MSREREGENWALNCVRLAERPEKPRQQGLTIAADRGLGVNAIDDLVETSAAHIDIVKFAMGVTRLMPLHVVEARIERYTRANIPVFLAGEISELAAIQGVACEYFRQIKRMGAWATEVSNAQIALATSDKTALIGAARNEGLEVIAECGRKGGVEWAESTALVISEVEACLDAGAYRVLIQAEGLNEGVTEVNTRLIQDLVARFGTESLIFQAKTSDLISWFVGSFGPHINLDVDADQVLDLEAQRRGIRKRGVFGLVCGQSIDTPNH